MNIFVAKLSADTTGHDLEDLFGEYGEISSAKVIMDRDTGRSKKFGFVEMPDDEAAQKAIDELDQCEFDYSTIVVKKAKPRTERKSAGSGW